MDADIATSIFHQQKLIWDDLSDHQFDTPARTRGQPDNLDDHSFDTPASSTGQPHNLALTARPAIEPNPPKKKRRLAYLKCDFCRGAKKKCEPSERQWPGEKCQRCDAKGFACSAPAKKRPGIYDAPSVDNTSSVAAVDNNNSLVAASERDQHEQRAYCALAEKCIEKMRIDLRTNICGLTDRNTEIRAISRTLIENVLSEDLQYACRFWIFHLYCGKDKFREDMDLQYRVYNFLTGYLLQWLEALALLQVIDGNESLKSLEQLVDITDDKSIRDFFIDAIRFVQSYKMDMKRWPVAVYFHAELRVRSGLMQRIYIPEVKFGFESDIRWVEEFWTPRKTVLWGHNSVVSDITFSPDGKLLVTASEDETVKLWDLTTRKELRTLEHDGQVRRVVFSPDGNSLACLVGYSSPHSLIQLWQPATGKRQEVFSVPVIWTSDITFSRDGKYLMVATANGSLKMRDLATQRWSGVFNHEDTGTPMAFSPDRTLLASAWRGIEVKIWDISMKSNILTVAHGGHVLAIAFSPDSKLLATLCAETLTVWDLAAGKELRTQAHHSTIASSTFLSDGKLLAYVSFDGEVGKWDLVTGIERRTPPRLGQHSRVIASSLDGKHIARPLNDYSVELLEIS